MNNETLEQSIAALAIETGRMLDAAGWTMATAESCTGGMVAAAVTEIAGSSAWFERGYVTYSNAAKSASLGVDAGMIEQYGAVSEPVARAMAEGALAASGASIAVAITGIAGPGGGSADKPVGTVCFAWSDGQRTHAETLHLQGDRRQVRLQSTARALRGISDWVTATATARPGPR